MGLDKDPDLHIRDPRIQAILDLMRSTAITLAEEITAVFTINK